MNNLQERYAKRTTSNILNTFTFKARTPETAATPWEEIEPVKGLFGIYHLMSGGADDQRLRALASQDGYKNVTEVLFTYCGASCERVLE